jgi:hypothetical protein
MSTRNVPDALEMPNETQACEKRRYTSPVLTRLGTVRELTRGLATGSHLDGVPFHHKNKP